MTESEYTAYLEYLASRKEEDEMELREYEAEID